MSTREKLGLSCLVAALLGVSPALVQAKAARPDPLPAEAGCDHYRGVPIGANDSSQQFEVVVCTTAEGVKAKVQTSSLVSGWSVRQAIGSWDPAGRVLTLQETEFLESKPEPDWRFCLINSIVLEKTEAGLSGNYVSEACNDRAKLELVKLDPEGSGEAPPSESVEQQRASSPPAPAREREPETSPEPEPAKSGCACTVTSAITSAAAGPLALALLLLAFAARRRRC